MAEHHDPVTGDKLTNLEYLTRQLQVGLRTPWFMLVFNLVTLVCIVLGWMFQWNAFASWLAIIVEWLVGTYMFGQTKRDAIILRAVKQLVEQEEHEIHDMTKRHTKRTIPPRDPVTGRFVRRDAA